MAWLYADENFPGPVVVLLRGSGHDVLTAREDGRADQGIPDSRVLARATDLGRVVLTLDHRDYRRLHRSGAAHAGIIGCSEDLDFPRLAGRTHDAITAGSTLAGQFIRVYLPNPPR